MSIFAEPKIDCHVHVIDPANFPYRNDVVYSRPARKSARPAQFRHVMDCYNVKHAPAGAAEFRLRKRQFLHARRDRERRGAVQGHRHHRSRCGCATLKQFKARGIIGAAINPTFHGNDYLQACLRPDERLADLDMYFNLQVENDQFLMYAPWIEEIPVKVLIDHVGRTDPSGWSRSTSLCVHSAPCRNRPRERQVVRLPEICPVSLSVRRLLAFVRALVNAFTLDHCVWSSDWPYLRAQERQDYGPLVQLAGQLFPNASDRRKLFWDTPNRLFKFADH
jgi:predicted TIM-barrel fold metal-dependent hydrolase